MNTIQQQWEFFTEFVIPKDAPPIQLKEMRLAFYAGAEAIMRMQWDIGALGVSEDAGIHMIEGWHDECKRFAQELAANAAP